MLTKRQQNTDFDENKGAFWSVKLVRLSVERLEMLVAEYGASLETDVLCTAPFPTQTLANMHTMLYDHSKSSIDC